MADGGTGGRAAYAHQVARPGHALLPKSRDKVTLTIVAAILVTVIGAAVYPYLPRSLVIDDLTRAQTHALSTSRDEPDIYAIEISGSGEFVGTVKLELVSRAGKVFHEVTLENGGSFEYQSDWYATEAFIRVTPGTARAGEISLRYRFLGVL